MIEANGITYKEAAKRLGTKPKNIASAVYYGNLTQLPSKGRESYVIEEQVKLFEGKPEISKKLLTPHELQQWKLLDAAYNPQGLGQNTPVRDLSQEIADAVALQQLAKYGPDKSIAAIAKQAIPPLQSLLDNLTILAQGAPKAQETHQESMVPANP